MLHGRVRCRRHAIESALVSPFLLHVSLDSASHGPAWLCTDGGHTCAGRQFTAMLATGLLRDMLSLHDSQSRQNHAIIVLGDSICGHR